MLRIRPSFTTAKSVPLIGLSAPSGPSPQEKRTWSPKPLGCADQLKPEIRKALLHAGDQRVDAVMAIAAHQGVDVSRIAGPVRGKHFAPAAWRSLVPQLDIAVGNGIDVGHFLSPSMAPVEFGRSTIEGSRGPIDYLAGHGSASDNESQRRVFRYLCDSVRRRAAGAAAGEQAAAKEGAFQRPVAVHAAAAKAGGFAGRVKPRHDPAVMAEYA